MAHVEDPQVRALPALRRSIANASGALPRDMAWQEIFRSKWHPSC